MDITIKKYGENITEDIMNLLLLADPDRESKYPEVDTGNSSIQQFYFYQSFGFRLFEIVKNFYSDYKKDIYKNGIRYIDMIRFRKEIIKEN